MNVSVLFASLVAAHSAVIDVEIDGISYPGRSGPVDAILGAKRIEWSTGSGLLMGYDAVADVNSPDITCSKGPKPPELKAVARAGSQVRVQWSNIVKAHWGPIMTYMGRLDSPHQKPQEVMFFKIDEKGFNASSGLWANEVAIRANNTDTMQIPSDIKPGLYILRTELFALHANSPLFLRSPLGGPQFFPHCFTVEIVGNGNVEPAGVTIPGAYNKTDPMINYDIYANKGKHKNYNIPGPPVYQGRYDPPTGPRPTVKETGIYPPELQKKYQVLKGQLAEFTQAIIGTINNYDVDRSDRFEFAFPDLARLTSSIGSQVGKIPEFIRGVQSFKTELEKVNKNTVR